MGRNEEYTRDQLNILLSAAALVTVIVNKFKIPLNLKPPEVRGDLQEDGKAFFHYLRSINNSVEAAHSKKLSNDIFQNLQYSYSVRIGNAFAYEFTQGDLNRIQQLINELRQEITNCEDLEQDHKQRLLKRLERMQSELHKRMPNLDRIFGFVADASVLMRKVGENAKPMVDRIGEILKIAWRAQARAEELPSDATSPLLEHLSVDDETMH